MNSEYMISVNCIGDREVNIRCFLFWCKLHQQVSNLCTFISLYTATCCLRLLLYHLNFAIFHFSYLLEYKFELIYTRSVIGITTTHMLAVLLIQHVHCEYSSRCWWTQRSAIEINTFKDQFAKLYFTCHNFHIYTNFTANIL